ncbi:MAG: hypothetical protein AB1763_05805 [Campylobacterota bacterium]
MNIKRMVLIVVSSLFVGEFLSANDDTSCFVKLRNYENEQYSNIRSLNSYNEPENFDGILAVGRCLASAADQNIPNCANRTGNKITMKASKLSCQINNYILVTYEYDAMPPAVTMHNFSETKKGKGKSAVTITKWDGSFSIETGSGRLGKKLVGY